MPRGEPEENCQPVSKTNAAPRQPPLKIPPKAPGRPDRLLQKPLEEGIWSALFTIQETIEFPLG